MRNRLQRVFLNGKSSLWSPVCAGVLQDYIVGPISVLMGINGLNNDIVSAGKLLSEFRSLFSVVANINVFLGQLNNDLEKVSK